jgi:peptidoglycan-associated lipoprotein
MKMLIVFVATLLLASCSSVPPMAQAPADEHAVAMAKPLPSKDVQAAMADAAKTGPYPERGVGGLIGERSIHYGFNQFTVPAEALPVVAAHGEFLLSHPTAIVVLQGNCDERGSREYNLGLGQRRADGVRKLLAAQGVMAGQLVAVSLGAETPRNPEHGEAAWAENRRTDIVYRGEPAGRP